MDSHIKPIGPPSASGRIIKSIVADSLLRRIAELRMRQHRLPDLRPSQSTAASIPRSR